MRIDGVINMGKLAFTSFVLGGILNRKQRAKSAETINASKV